MLISLLFQNPIQFLLIALALVVSLTIHEFAHSLVADKLGDPTPRSFGRLSLNPLAHLDPVGTLLLLTAGIGWGKPVPHNPGHFKNPKRDSALVAFSGPFSNFVLAAFFAILITAFGMGGLVGGFLYTVVFYNLILGFFNLIPVHPLDGFKVVNGLLSEGLSWQWLQMAPFGIYILFVLILTGTVSRILNPLINVALKILGL